MSKLSVMGVALAILMSGSCSTCCEDEADAVQPELGTPATVDSDLDSFPFRFYPRHLILDLDCPDFRSVGCFRAAVREIESGDVDRGIGALERWALADIDGAVAYIDWWIETLPVETYIRGGYWSGGRTVFSDLKMYRYASQVGDDFVPSRDMKGEYRIPFDVPEVKRPSQSGLAPWR